jgi:hypothetical protein
MISSQWGCFVIICTWREGVGTELAMANLSSSFLEGYEQVDTFEEDDEGEYEEEVKRIKILLHLLKPP